MTQDRPVWDRPRVVAMSGSATFTMLASSTTISWATSTVASARAGREVRAERRPGRPDDGPAEDCGGVRVCEVTGAPGRGGVLRWSKKWKAPPVNIRRVPPLSKPFLQQ